MDYPQLAKGRKTPAFVQLPEIFQPSIFSSSSTIAEMSRCHANSFNMNSFNNVWNSYTVADDRSQLLDYYHPRSLDYGIRIFKSATSTTLVNGSCKLKSSEVGMTGVAKVKVIRGSCLVMEIQGPGRHSSGNDYSSRGGKSTSTNMPRY